MNHRLALAALTAALLAGVAAPTSAAHAQGGGQRGGMMGNQQQMTDRLFEGITLSAEQKDKVKAVEEKFRPRMEAMREEMRGAMQGGAPNPELRQKMTALNTEQRDALRAVLTPDQQKVFDENVKKMPQRGGPGGGGRPPVTR